MNSVGRPPELDSHGKVVQKSLVNVTIPTKLANFLKEKGINRSQLFTSVVKRMYRDELCRFCYGSNIEESRIGKYCVDCELARPSENPYTVYNNCKNCGNKYQPPYTFFRQSKKIESGCDDCVPKEERL